jgi:hypothetical protein
MNMIGREYIRLVTSKFTWLLLFTFTVIPSAGAQVEWKAQSKGGFILSSGNSQTQSMTLGLSASRKEGNNKLTLEGGIAYGKSKNLIAVTDGATPATIVSVSRHEVVSTNNWSTKGRYDRFLTENNSLFVSALGAADKVVGKAFFGGGQLGYSRQIFQNEMHLFVAEFGYDFSYESYMDRSGITPKAISIHSARAFLGETLKLTGETGAKASVEALFNLNEEGNAQNAKNGESGVKAFNDTRLTGKIALTSNLRKNLSMGLGFTVKYDQNPAPRPTPSGTSAAYPATFASFKYADKTDTITEATLIYTFF